MVEFTPELLAILGYTAFALFLSLYFVPFKVVPKAWAKAVQTKGHPAQVALDAVLEGAAPKVAKAITLPAFEPPKMADGKTVHEVLQGLRDQFNQVVPMLQNLGDEAWLEARMKKAYSDMRAMERARDGKPEAGELSPSEKQELDALARDPDGKAQLVAAEMALDYAVDQGWMKPALAKKIKGMLNSAFLNGQPLEQILAPYQALLERAAGARGAPSVRLAQGATQRSSGFNPG